MASAANVNKQKEHIQAFLRVRPKNSNETEQRLPSIIDIISKRDVNIVDSVGGKKSFTFDRVFGPNSKQSEIYKEVLQHTVQEVLAGYNCTVFAYGQTGSGKTYTMEGKQSHGYKSGDIDPEFGIIPRALSHLFDKAEKERLNHVFKVSFLEIYNEELIDLLAPPVDRTKLKLFENSNKKGSVIVNGLEERTVSSKNEIHKILEEGSNKRQTACTLMNAQSSRSHTIFSITVRTTELTEGEEFIKIGKLNLVDLAGSENIGRSGAVDKHAREAGNINQSLLTLGRVITSLVEHRPHVPYRESKLTRILQDSLGGRTKTSIIATISPTSIDFEVTLSTLNYASRAKNIINKPEVNQKLTPKYYLREYDEELERLRRDLKAERNKDGIYISEINYNDMLARLANSDQAISEKLSRIEFLEEEREKLQEIVDELEAKAAENQAKIAEFQEKITEIEEKCEEEKFIAEYLAKNETVLISQANKVQNVASVAADHVDKLHAKIDRFKNVEEKNLNSVNRLYDLLNQYFNDIVGYFDKFIDGQVNFQEETKDRMINFHKTAEQFLVYVLSKTSTIDETLPSASLNSFVEKLAQNRNLFIKIYDNTLEEVKKDIDKRQYETDKFFNEVVSSKINNLFENMEKLKILFDISQIEIQQKFEESKINVSSMEGVVDNIEKVKSDSDNLLNKISNSISASQQNEEEILNILESQKKMIDDIIKEQITSVENMEQKLKGNIQKIDVNITRGVDCFKEFLTDSYEYSMEVCRNLDHEINKDNEVNLECHQASLEIEDELNEMLKELSNIKLDITVDSNGVESAGLSEKFNCSVDIINSELNRINNENEVVWNSMSTDVIRHVEKIKEQASNSVKRLETAVSKIGKRFDGYSEGSAEGDKISSYKPTGNTPKPKDYSVPCPVELETDFKVPSSVSQRGRTNRCVQRLKMKEEDDDAGAGSSAESSRELSQNVNRDHNNANQSLPSTSYISVSPSSVNNINPNLVVDKENQIEQMSIKSKDLSSKIVSPKVRIKGLLLDKN